MFRKIKNRLESELAGHVAGLDKEYSFSSISPILSKNIKSFLSRKGKMMRPIFFVVSYLGFTKKIARNLYRSALSLELLHNFMLIHDDIIDDSSLRRGVPSMHKMLDEHLKHYKNAKFGGKELAIIVGDIIYAMAINSFLSIDEDPKRKEEAMKQGTKAAIYTGSGEFLELLYAIKDIDTIKEKDIYKIYDLKTGYYSFSSPLVMGAMLSGADKQDTDKLFKYGIYLGRAFQIRDDILDIFGEEQATGKSALADMKEAKKTLILCHAYKKASHNDKSYLKRILNKNTLIQSDSGKIRKIMTETGSLDYAKAKIAFFVKNAKDLCAELKMRDKYKKILYTYPDELMKLDGCGLATDL